MATKKSANKAPTGLIIQTLDIKQVNRSSVDINKWRNALKSAEGTTENRKAIYELYADMILDGHLKSVTEKRIKSITNTEIAFQKDGKTVDELTPIIKSKAFKYILRQIIAAKLYGHSLIECYIENEKLVAKIVDRRHVKPRFGIVVASPSDVNGIPFREPPYSNFTIEVGDPDDFGLMLQAAQYVIYKRGVIGDWADYIQLFGVPFRHAKYKNPEDRKIIEEALENMGSTGWAVTPDNVIIEIIRAEGATGANLIFKNFKEFCNDEMSITMLGQTMTTSDTKNSGYAQGKIHKDVEDDIHRDDRAFVITLLNDEVIKVLANLGYPVEGGLFSYPEKDTLSLKERIEIDIKVVEMVPIDQDYFYDKYGIPKPTGSNTVGGYVKKQEPEPSKVNPDDSKKPKKEDKLSARLTHNDENSDSWWRRLFSFFVPAPASIGAQMSDPDELYQLADKPKGLKVDSYTLFIKSIEALLEKLARKEISPADLDKNLFAFTSANLLKASEDGLGIKWNDIDFGKPDNLLFKKMHENIFSFAGFKTYHNLRDINDLLLDEKGKLIPFSQFKDKLRDYKEKALGISDKYNQSWLYSEYQTAVIQGQHATEWKGFEDNADIFPNLTYKTSGDDRVRHSHARLDGVTKPVGDKFWNKYAPQNDWGCRCYLESTDKKATRGAINAFSVPDEFAYNVGKTGSIYNEKHPFYNTKEAAAINKSIKNLRK